MSEEGKDFVQAALFPGDFHTPVEGDAAWELDTGCLDYQW